MYAWIFRHLPGPAWVRILTCILLVAVVVLLLLQVVFPAASAVNPWTDSIVGLRALPQI